MRLFLGILIGGIAAVSSPYAASWFAHALAWIKTNAPGAIAQIQALFAQVSGMDFDAAEYWKDKDVKKWW